CIMSEVSCSSGVRTGALLTFLGGSKVTLPDFLLLADSGTCSVMILAYVAWNFLAASVSSALVFLIDLANSKAAS
ncbi:hypothetical protein Tco_0547088, partial [Tanacetum coccineum]